MLQPYQPYQLVAYLPACLPGHDDTYSFIYLFIFISIKSVLAKGQQKWCKNKSSLCNTSDTIFTKELKASMLG